MPDQFTQQEVMRRFGVKPSTVMSVLRHLAELGACRAQARQWLGLCGRPLAHLNESYAFRRALEPQILLQPGFKLDRAWAEGARPASEAAQDAMACGDGTHFHTVNAEFHEQLARSSGNRAMLRAVNARTSCATTIGQWDAIPWSKSTARSTIIWRYWRR